MTYQETIHRYLAGEATHEEEASLFDGLADHPEWREELQFQMEMERATKGDLGSVRVPNATTSDIFSKLGFSRRVASASLLLQLLQRPRLLVATLAAVAGIMSVSYLLTEPSSIPTSKMSVPVASSPITVPQPIAVLPPERPANITTSKPSVRPAQSLPNNQPPDIPNEPMTIHLDIAEFSSVAYLTPQKIIGVASGGRIYISTDAGKRWALQKSGTTNDLFGVSFIDTSYGIAVGSKGLILKTSSSGEEWQRIESNMTASFNTVRFATADTVYICGDNGVIMRSTNGGSTWHPQSAPTTANLFRLLFQNGSNGEVRGEHGVGFITHNGGETWEAAQ